MTQGLNYLQDHFWQYLDLWSPFQTQHRPGNDPQLLQASSSGGCWGTVAWQAHHLQCGQATLDSSSLDRAAVDTCKDPGYSRS